MALECQLALWRRSAWAPGGGPSQVHVSCVGDVTNRKIISSPVKERMGLHLVRRRVRQADWEKASPRRFFQSESLTFLRTDEDLRKCLLLTLVEQQEPCKWFLNPGNRFILKHVTKYYCSPLSFYSIISSFLLHLCMKMLYWFLIGNTSQKRKWK